jgi:4-hydroxy-2-oxoglutarate aldolase
VGELVTRSAGDFQVLVGSGALLYGALELGAVGGILGVANYATADSAGIYEAFARGDSAEAGRIQERVAPAHNDIVAALGVPGVKVAVDMIGMKGGDPRAPLRPLGTGGRDAVEKALREAGLEVVGTAA